MMERMMAEMPKPQPDDVLILVDMQNDFCPGGALGVPEGDAIVPLVNRLAEQFDHIILTQDWHPAGHHSFASSHPGRQPFETITVAYGQQVLWPDHCIQGSEGAAFHPALDVPRAELVLRKGFRREIDSYSIFRENDRQTRTGLDAYLRERGLRRLFLAGLALDFCVAWSALDGRAAGYEVVVLEDACRAIDLDGSLERARGDMIAAGVLLTVSDKVAA